MSDRGLRDVLEEGFEATRPYLLSHHEPHEYDRCYTVSRRRNVRLCARCVGIYPGIVAGLVVAWVGVLPIAPLIVVGLFPLPGLIDWTVTATRSVRGRNSVRTLSGGALGFGYGVGLIEILVGHDLRVIAIGALYALVAGLLLATVDR